MRSAHRLSVFKTTTVVGAAIVSLGLCEIGTRALYPAPPDPGREPPILYKADPEVGWQLVPNQAGWLDDGFVTINSLGFRGREPRIPKPEGQFHLLVLGDSITLGWGVNDEEPYPAQLERMLRRSPVGRDIDVINCGVWGYNTVQEDRLFNRFATRLEPNLVLVGFYWNDLPPPPQPSVPSSRRWLPAPLPGGDGTLYRAGTAPSWLNRKLRQSRAIFCIKNGLIRIRNAVGWRDTFTSWQSAILEGTESVAIAEAWSSIEDSLSDIRSVAARYGSRVGVIVLPSREQVANNYPNARYQSRVREIAERLGLFVIDPLPRFRNSHERLDELFIPYDNDHPGPAGHKLVAEAIADSLREHPELLEPTKRGA